MKLPAWKFLKAETSTADAIGEQLAEMDRAYAAADAELSRLAALRPGLLLDVTTNADGKLERQDADMAAARRVLEATAARRAALEEQWRQAEAKETAAHLARERRERHAAAVRAREEGIKLLAVYRAQAPALAETLRRLVEIEGLIEAANADLPSDAAPIGPAEPFNGRLAVPDVWGSHEVWVDADGAHRGVAQPGQAPPVRGATRKTVYDYTATPGVPGYPHRPLAGRVHLPAIAPDAAPFWAPGQPVPAADAATLLRFYGFRR